MKKQAFLSGAFILLTAAATNAAVTWSVPSGSTPTFDYTDGQSHWGRFGDGVPSAYGFTFTPGQFVASANGTNSPVSTSDTTSVVIHSPGPMFSATASFFGDYSILGIGSADAIGALTATNLDTQEVVSTPLAVSGVPVAIANAAGGFYGSSTVDMMDGWTNFKLELNATVVVTAGLNGVAIIQGKSGEIVVRGKFLPEPASLSLLAGVSTLLVRRTRR